MFDENEDVKPEETSSAEQAPQETAASDLTKDTDLDRQDYQWYVVNTYTGRERAVRDSLENRSKNLNFSNLIRRIIVAEYEDPVIKDGKPVTDKKTGAPKFKIKNYYPGYVFIEMKMSDEAWYMVRNTPDVTGFVGSSGKGTKPFPIPRAEIEPILKKLKIADWDYFSDYKVGDMVKILSGAFEDNEGPIISVNSQTQEVSVNITFFGRPTPIVARFDEIEKI